MTISTETIILKVEGQTDGAVRATDKLAQAQKKLKQEVQSTSKAMADIPATKTAGLLGAIGDGLKSVGFDAKTFSGGLKDIGKGLTFDLIRQGLKGLNADMKGVAGSALSAGVNGAAMGAAFGGPLGAAIGGAAGALVGLIRHTDQQTAASLRAAEATKKHAAALRALADGETKARMTRREARRAVELAEEEENQAELNATKAGLGIDSVDVRRARDELNAARDKLESLNRADGVIWLEQKQRERERIALQRQTNAAIRSGIIDSEEAKRRLNEFDGVQEKSTETAEKATKVVEKHTAAIKERTYASVQAALSAQGATRGMDTAGRVIGFSTALGAVADTTQRDMFGHDQEAAILEKHREDLRKQEEAEAEMRRARDAATEKARSARRGAALEDAFGKLDDINAYKVAFDGLTGAVTSAMQAWIDGSMSAGQAAKKFAGEYLSTVAVSMAIEALKEGAYAVASLIPGPFFNPAAAAGHAAAAAEYGVAAAAAGAAAKLFGSGGAQTPSGGGASAGSPSGGSSSSDPVRRGDDGSGSSSSGTKETFVIYESTFAEGSPRYRRQRAARVVNEVRGGLAWSNE